MLGKWMGKQRDAINARAIRIDALTTELEYEHEELEVEQNEAAIIKDLFNTVAKTKRKKNNKTSQ